MLLVSSILIKLSIFRMTNGAGNSQTGRYQSQETNGNSGNAANLFHQSSAADEPYFAHNRMHDRSAHVSRLSDQIDRTDEILKR